MIEVYPNIVELVGSAVQNFESNKYESLPRDFPNESPVDFAPYLEDSAAFEAMRNAGIDSLHNTEMKDLLIGAIRTIVSDIEQIKQQRQSLARRLNEPLH